MPQDSSCRGGALAGGDQADQRQRVNSRVTYVLLMRVYVRAVAVHRRPDPNVNVHE